jgi:hypothetical protein
VNRDFPSQQSLYLTGFLVSQLSAPDLDTLLNEHTPPAPIVSLNSTVLSACKIMQEVRCCRFFIFQEGSTAVLVLENESRLIAGIFLLFHR